MFESLIPLLVSLISFSLGSFMMYWILKDKQKWDGFWEDLNRDRPLAPDWAGSRLSRAFTYLMAVLLLLGGFLGMCRSLHIF